ncbi:MAG: aminoglycoside phosphotransferase family protein [Acidobacteria bacterium]|nr:MAG: aminoglycoside phosphotransferase family protein [Acidobacteriota bacterium]
MAEFRLTPETLGHYLAHRGLANDPAELSIRELGGGVSNFVSLIEGPGIRWVAKQSLGKLRVKDNWTSQRERIFREAAAIESLGPILDGAVPQVVHVDRENFLFVMTAAPEGAVVWKKSLLDGQVRMEVAKAAGRLLAAMVKAGQQGTAFREHFSDRTVFDELRIDPYYRTAAARCPVAHEALRQLIEDSLKIQRSLVHGDFSPKNMLVSAGNIFLIDFEVVHWGDPAFDSGFLLSHLMLKAFHQPQYAELYFEAARAFWQALTAGLSGVQTVDFEAMTVRHLGGLMLARMDGKSPVEYISDEGVKSRVRRAAIRLLTERPESFRAALELMAPSIVEASIDWSDRSIDGTNSPNKRP